METENEVRVEKEPVRVLWKIFRIEAESKTIPTEIDEGVINILKKVEMSHGEC